jgi:hypothetical protein
MVVIDIPGACTLAAVGVMLPYDVADPNVEKINIYI